MSEIQIVPSTLAHLPGILDQTRATFDEHRARVPKAFPDAVLLKLEERHRDAIDLADEAPISFSALIDGIPAGFVLLRPLAKFALIYDIGVFPHARRQGIGSALLRHVLLVGADRKWDQIVASVWDGNTASHQMFQSAGFKAQIPFLGLLAKFMPKSRTTLYLTKLKR